MLDRQLQSSRSAHIGQALTLGGWCFFSMTDMALSSVAFLLGVSEANPVLAWFASRGLFTPAKLVLTGLVVGLMALAYPHRPGRRVAWGVVLVMAGVTVYHLWGLHSLGYL
jgi:hypothetical protein